MITIEFIGIPGSGKSTLRNLLVKEISKLDPGLNCIGSDDAYLRAAKGNIDLFFRLVLNSLTRGMGKKFLKKIGIRSYYHFQKQNEFLSRHGRALRVFLDSDQYQKMSFEDREIVISGFLSAASHYMAIKDGPEFDGFVLFDEGLIQKSMMFVSGLDSPKPPEENFKNYLDSIPLPDLCVYVTADIDRCGERMGNRPKGLIQRLKKTEKDIILRFLGNAELHMNTLIKMIEEKGKTKVLKIDNNGSRVDVVQSLIASLLDYRVQRKRI